MNMKLTMVSVQYRNRIVTVFVPTVYDADGRTRLDPMTVQRLAANAGAKDRGVTFTLG